MIKSDIVFGSKDVSPRREEMICTSGGLVSIVAKFVLSNCGIGLVNTAWSVQLQLDDGGETT